VNVIKYLRKHLEDAKSALSQAGETTWDRTEGKLELVWGADLPAERVWLFRLPRRWLPTVIGGQAAPELGVE